MDGHIRCLVVAGQPGSWYPYGGGLYAWLGGAERLTRVRGRGCASRCIMWCTSSRSTPRGGGGQPCVRGMRGQCLHYLTVLEARCQELAGDGSRKVHSVVEASGTDGHVSEGQPRVVRLSVEEEVSMRSCGDAAW
eukprot:55898-Eustigmatos_ZCMA.PRE.1